MEKGVKRRDGEGMKDRRAEQRKRMLLTKERGTDRRDQTRSERERESEKKGELRRGVCKIRREGERHRKGC